MDKKLEWQLIEITMNNPMDAAKNLLIIQRQMPEENFRYLTNMDHALIGLDKQSNRLVYSSKWIFDKLLETMTVEEADEYYEHNILPLTVGGKCPIICDDRILEE